MPNESFEKYWAPVAAIIGAVLLIINFFNALQGDKTFVTFALILVSLAAIVAGTWKYAFSKSQRPFEKNGKYGFYPKYRYHWFAKVILTLASVSILISIFYVLTVIELIPDCCGLVPIKILTATPTVISTTTDTIVPTVTPANTALITPTLTPDNLIPTETTTITPVLQASFPDYFITDCIAYRVWYFWKGNEDIPVSYDAQNRGCYDLTNWHLTAQRKDPNSAIQGLRINIESDRNIMNGIFLPLGNEADIKLSLDIEQLTSNIKCDNDENCDANLIIGFGEPVYGSQGWFLAYRATTRGSDIITCLVKSSFSDCGSPIKQELGNIFLKHDLEFILNGQDLTIKVDEDSYPGPSIAIMRRQLWIGYQTRSTGTIKAFIQFK